MLMFKQFYQIKLTTKIPLFVKFLNYLSLGKFTKTKANDCNITDARLDSCDFI